MERLLQLLHFNGERLLLKQLNSLRLVQGNKEYVDEAALTNQSQAVSEELSHREWNYGNKLVNDVAQEKVPGKKSESAMWWKIEAYFFSNYSNLEAIGLSLSWMVVN